VLEQLGLSGDEAAVYQELLDSPRSSTDELAAAGRLDHNRVVGAVQRLEAAGLANRASDDPDLLVPAPPQQAFEPALLERERELHEARACVQSLAAKWRQATHAMEADGAVSPVQGVQACLELWREAHGSARTQVRALDRPPYLLPQTEPNPVEVDLLARRVPHRVVYDSAVIALPGRFDELKAGIQSGEKARVHPAVPFRALLIDDRMALLPMQTGHRVSDGLFIVRPCAILDALGALFEGIWQQAVPLRFDEATERETVDPDTSFSHLILKLMAAGLSDAKIARQLGVSERTLQRRLATVMNHLGARTRLQAGVQAARKGWV
jgi:DNA-binding MarR family transcriptional regulator/AraC-like DNA-binding protein